MSRIHDLLRNYQNHIRLPWLKASSWERTMTCIYEPADERQLRLLLVQFESVTKTAGHGWYVYDITNVIERWLVSNDYAESYFEDPELIETLGSPLDFMRQELEDFIAQTHPTDQDVIAVHGAGMMYGYERVQSFMDALAPLVPGRMLVFFPGRCDNNNFRLLDLYDGGNYRTVVISAHSDNG